MLLRRAWAYERSFKSCRSDVALPSAVAAAAAVMSSCSICTSCALFSMLVAQRARASCNRQQKHFSAIMLLSTTPRATPSTANNKSLQP
jgi:hypothetical protein